MKKFPKIVFFFKSDKKRYAIEFPELIGIPWDDHLFLKVLQDDIREVEASILGEKLVSDGYELLPPEEGLGNGEKRIFPKNCVYRA